MQNTVKITFRCRHVLFEFITVGTLDAGVAPVLSWKTARITPDRYLLCICSKYFICVTRALL